MLIKDLKLIFAITANKINIIFSKEFVYTGPAIFFDVDKPNQSLLSALSCALILVAEISCMSAPRSCCVNVYPTPRP